MDFAGRVFDGEISFAERFLLLASFEGTTFEGSTVFRDAVFVGTANFSHVEFRDRTRFDNVTFDNTAYFKNGIFAETTSFNGSVFKSGANFQNAVFVPVERVLEQKLGAAGFQGAVFEGLASFKGVKFEVQSRFTGARFLDGVDFQGVSFMKEADFGRATFEQMSEFSSARFENEADFNDATFKATTNFRESVFKRPPKFFETNLHEDTDFSGINWRKAEASYAVPWWSAFGGRHARDGNRTAVVDAREAIQAWDRLALIMSKLEKLPERHDFYRLRMRAQRSRDGWSILSVANWLFDVSLDYGWSLRRTVVCWSGHVIFVGLLLYAFVRSHVDACGSVFWDSLLVSFSNAHAFLGLASKGGYLEGSRDCLATAVVCDTVMHTVGVIQAIIGPVLLFLLLLTLRNRFRLR